MIKKIILIVAPALCILLCLYFSIHAWLSYKDNYIKVPVASHQLYQRICLKEEDLEEIDVPKAFLSNDVYLSKDGDSDIKFADDKRQQKFLELVVPKIQLLSIAK